MGISQDLISPECLTAAEDFDCIICREFAFDPRVCQRCKKLFCSVCITEWLDKNEKCPFKCSESKMNLMEMSDEQLVIYILIELRCTKKCGKFVTLIDYKDHIATCDLSNCPNYALCNRKACYSYKGGDYCSYFCYKVVKFGQLNSKNENSFYKIALMSSNSVYKHNFPYKWDFKKSSESFRKVSKNTVSLENHGFQVFRTAVSAVALIGGINRVKFFIKNSNFHIKVGVTTTIDFDLNNVAFSDLETGFAFYTLGQTRNESLNSGILFGEKIDLKGECTIDMEVNMGEGKINFWVNGKSFGTAFEEKILSESRLYPAIAVGKDVGEIRIFVD
jgi:hypothetical protein